MYELVETLGLIGHAVYLKRTDGSRINPFLIQVLKLAVHHRVVDSITL